MNSAETSALEAEWRAAVGKALRGAGPEMLVHRTLDAIPIEPLYGAANSCGAVSGRAPGRWRISQRLDHPDLTEANRLALADLEGGADSLTLVAEDAPSARGFGLPLRSGEDLDAVLAGVQLNLVELRLDPGPEPFGSARFAAQLAERRGYDLADLELDLGIDPVGTLATAGALAAEWDAIARDMTVTLRDWSARDLRGRAFRADGRPWSEAGATEAQELAAVLGTAVLYLRALEANGVPPDLARDALSFTLVADTDLVLTIAKFRALRSLWAAVENACGLEARPIRLHAETAWRGMGFRSAETNIVRGAMACFAAAIGGADGITVLPFTLPLGLPDAFARRLARNTQHVLAEEAQLWRVADPAAGAGAFEDLTRQLCDRSWHLFQEIEQEGGIVNSLAAGKVQRRVAAARAERRARLADGGDALVGITIFESQDELPPPVPMRPRGKAIGAAAGPLRAEPLVPGRDAEAFECRDAASAGAAEGEP